MSFDMDEFALNSIQTDTQGKFVVYCYYIYIFSISVLSFYIFVFELT